MLRQARARNRRQRHHSGPLLHTPDGQFLQILAGEETVVRALYYDRIAADPRHHRGRLPGAGARAERSFADWNMGFRVARARELAAAPERVLFAPQPRVRPELLKRLLNFVAHHEREPDSYL